MVFSQHIEKKNMAQIKIYVWHFVLIILGAFLTLAIDEAPAMATCADWTPNQVPQSVCDGLTGETLKERLSQIHRVEIDASDAVRQSMTRGSDDSWSTDLEKAKQIVKEKIISELKALTSFQKKSYKDVKFVESVTFDADNYIIFYRFADGYAGQFSLKIAKENIEAHHKRLDAERKKAGYVKPTREELDKESTALATATAIYAKAYRKHKGTKGAFQDAIKEMEKVDGIAEVNPDSEWGDVTIVHKSGRAAVIMSASGN